MPVEPSTFPAPVSIPVNPANRIDAIDILRGLALLGVLAINVVNEFRVSIFQQFLPSAESLSASDRAVQAVLTTGIEMKAFALFSLLFGIGMAIQFERLSNNPRRAVLLVRRLVILLVIGLVHLFLIWNGDILAEYSLAGLTVLPFLWGPRWLLAAAAVFFLALFLAMPWLPPVVAWPGTAWISRHVVEATQAYGMGGFWEVLAFRIHEVPSILPLHVFIFPRTLALFLFGILAWRADVLRGPAKQRLVLLTGAIAGIVAGCLLTLAAQMQAMPTLWQLQVAGERLGAVLLAGGYAAGITLIADSLPGRRMLGWAAPLGRMAFSNYLAQSIIFGWIFYGYGLGLFGRLGVITALAIGTGVYIVQAVTSAQWLEHYRFGPVEWFWRSLMYGNPQRLRLGTTPHRSSAW